MDTTQSTTYKIYFIEGRDTSLKPKAATLCLSDTITIQGDDFHMETPEFDEVVFAELHRLGHYIEVRKGDTYLSLFVPRIYLNIGSGFMVFHLAKTKKLYTELQSKYLSN